MPSAGRTVCKTEPHGDGDSSIPQIFKFLLTYFIVPLQTMVIKDIEKEGWVKTYYGEDNKSIGFTKGNFFMIWQPDTQALYIIIMDPSKVEDMRNPEYFRFFCICDSAKKLKTLDKLLNTIR